MQLRNTPPRKHVHLWKLTKHTYHAWSGVARLERECTGCGHRQHTVACAADDLPPEPLLAIADLCWYDGKLK